MRRSLCRRGRTRGRAGPIREWFQSTFIALVRRWLVVLLPFSNVNRDRRDEVDFAAISEFRSTRSRFLLPAFLPSSRRVEGQLFRSIARRLELQVDPTA